MPSSMIRKLNSLLKTENLGKVIRYFDVADSTNTVLFELAEKGASEGTAVIADSQTKGKGRLGRTWVSPGGHNLYMSILLRPGGAASESSLVTLMASIALCDCIKKMGIENPQIKWPNDILIERRKVAGVLTELKSEGEKAEFIVLGIGVNVNMTRSFINMEMSEFGRTATSLSENLGREIDRAKFTADLLLELERWYDQMHARGKSSLLKEWMLRWGGRGERVRVSIPGKEIFEGIADGIEENGSLLVKTEDGEVVSVLSGDVTII